MATDDPFHLQRFVQAQQNTYDQAHAELAAGRKQSHWMWFVFPQIAGLGRSETAQRYAIRNTEEATAYLAHPLLGPRLRECTALATAVDDKSPFDIFGTPDDLKFHSSVTLFAHIENQPGTVFIRALEKYFHGQGDAATLVRLPPEVR